jgi:endoglucanase
MIKKYLGYFFIIFGVSIFLYVTYMDSKYAYISRPFSSYTLLVSSWEKYKQQFINQDGRVVDDTQKNTTTSEGQSYAMLRAVYIDDKESFDKVWQWTKNNLKRPSDNLFGWRWGLNNQGTYGFLENGGDNSASDADTDIALALIFAGKRWNNDNYTNQAKTILQDIWNKETGVANSKRYLIAGNWANSSNELIINPSYFSPYAWRIFAKVDTKNDWSSLIAPAYTLLINSGQNKLDQNQGVGLPPDWLAINKTNGTVSATQIGSLTTNYSFDAMRIPWKIALDYQWNKDQNAYNYLLNSYKRLSEIYTQEDKLPTALNHSGQILQNQENPTMYATALGYFMIVEPEAAKKIYEEKILRLYSNDQNTFNSNIPYYEQNWLWFGSGIYNHQLVPFT